MGKLPRVLILYTGGTFGMQADGANAGLALPNLSPDLLKRNLESRVPELALLARCEVNVLMNRDSANIGPADWVHFAGEIRESWNKFDGVVLLHGTDTLPYTASALSFLLRPCRNPVVLTGAQKPLSAIRTDARRNLISAVEIAARGPASCRQVTVFFDDLLFQGNRVRKRSATQFAGFHSPRQVPLARVGTSIDYDPNPSPGIAAARGMATLKIEPRFERRVAMLHVTPGFPAECITVGLLDRLAGLVLVIFPSGTAPTQDSDLLKMLRQAKARGIPVVIATEGIDDRALAANPAHYPDGIRLLDEGCYWAGAMTPECAFVKTALILGQSKRSPRLFSALWRRDFSGER